MRVSWLAAASLALASPVLAHPAPPRDFAAWLDQAIARNMVFPAALERSNANGIATVRFSVGSNGRATDIGIVRSSGDSTIDSAALATIARLDLPADAPAGPHYAVLQYGTAANAAQAEAFALQLRHARGQAQLAMRALERARLARRVAAPGIDTLN